MALKHAVMYPRQIDYSKAATNQSLLSVSFNYLLADSAELHKLTPVKRANLFGRAA